MKVSGNKMFFDNDHCNEISYKSNTFQIVDSRVVKELSSIFSWVCYWNHWDRRGAAYFQSKVCLDMPFIRCREEETYQSRVSKISELL